MTKLTLQILLGGLNSGEKKGKKNPKFEQCENKNKQKKKELKKCGGWEWIKGIRETFPMEFPEVPEGLIKSFTSS